MSRRVKEFIDIGEHISLDELIGKLVEVRDGIPDEAEAELKRGRPQPAQTKTPLRCSFSSGFEKARSVAASRSTA